MPGEILTQWRTCASRSESRVAALSASTAAYQLADDAECFAHQAERADIAWRGLGGGDPHDQREQLGAAQRVEMLVQLHQAEQGSITTCRGGHRCAAEPGAADDRHP